MLSVKDVCNLLRIPRSSYYLLRKRPDFPKAVRFGLNRVRHDKQEILDWIAKQPRKE